MVRKNICGISQMCAVLADRAGQRIDAERGAERNQPVPQHDTEPRRHASEKTPLDGPLQSEQIDRAQRQGQQQSHDHADGDDQKEVADVQHDRAIPRQVGASGAWPPP
jgi:hypothetical protein